jgi:hypothetical protein
MCHIFPSKLSAKLLIINYLQKIDFVRLKWLFSENHPHTAALRGPRCYTEM